MAATWFCLTCKRDKPRSAFSESQVRSSTGRGRCKACHIRATEDLRTRQVTKRHHVCQLPGCGVDISDRGWNAKWCSPACAAKGWRLANPGAHRTFWIKSVYGVTAEHFDQLLDAQGGCCAICEQTPTAEAGRASTQWNVDHCHGTGVVRGLLCRGCNVGIGQLKDDPQLVRRAAEYVEHYLVNGLVLPEVEILGADPNPALATDSRYCSLCELARPRSAFSPRVFEKSRWKAWCRECRAKWNNGDRPARRHDGRTCEAPGCTVNISRMRADARWCSKACTARGWRHENPGAGRDYTVRTLYGISAEQAAKLLDSQDGKCAICRVIPAGHWNIDHCHDTGSVRGVLCSGCNLGIGSLGDDPVLLRHAVAYLENHLAAR